MRYDQSFGIVPLQKVAGRMYVFIIRHRGGHWTLPKGHPEGEETPLESAQRELFEETGLSVDRFISEEPLIESYQFSSRGKPIHKTVHYFIAEVSGAIRIQKEELQDGRWVELVRAHRFVTYAQMKTLLNTVLEKVSI
ncbi:MAG: NUDIX domain-containing protein [Verrucomicrobia bacterium]|nr:NUDIX domain-containing protein [Verrucomicrobiota bacterium]